LVFCEWKVVGNIMRPLPHIHPTVADF